MMMISPAFVYPLKKTWMTTIARCLARYSRTGFKSLVITTCAILLSAPIAGAVEQNIIFLPLNVVAPDVDELFVEQIDERYATALAQKGFALADRQLFDYRSWPPPTDELRAISAAEGADYAAAGAITVIGSQLSLDVTVYDALAPDTPFYIYQEAASLAELDLVLATVTDDIIAYGERRRLIAAVSPEGNQRIDSGAILRQIQTKTGDYYQPEALREDLKAIYDMGYFEDVQIDVIDTDQGKEVIFRVIEKPVISSITITGVDRLKDDEVREVVTLRENSILNPLQVNATAAAITQLYRNKGYYNTLVTPTISFPTAETAAVRFAVDEGRKVYIKDITFTGNTTFKDSELRDTIQTREKNWLSWLTQAGLLDRDVVNQDIGRIVAFYQNNGFLEARVGEPEITQEEESLFVNFTVEEGPRFKVGRVDIEGDLIADKQVFLDMLTIRNEEYMSRQVLREDILKITDFYAEQGFAFAEVRPNIEKSESGARVDLNLRINKGDLVYINRIVIQGNTRTRDNVIRRDLQIAEGGVFDAKGLRTSNERLQRLDFFEEITITPEPALDPSKMNVTIDVKEKSTGQFSVGAGYSSVDNFMVMGEISENNFLGLGQRLSLTANIGGKSTRYNLAWTNPRVYDTQLSMGVDLYNWRREFTDYTRDSTGGALRFGHPFWGKWRLYESYSYTNTDLSDVSENASFIIRESQNVPVTSALEFSLIRDTRDRLYGASKGSRNRITTKYAGGFLQGDAQFTKVEGSSGWYFPIAYGTVFHFLGAAGIVSENKEDKLPVYERFYLGGLNSIRGFKYGDVSPVDPETGDRIGGNRMWYINSEIVLPLLKDQGVFGVVFFDAGQNVANDFSSSIADDIDKGVGVELRWLSPLGPLRVVWGYNLDPLPDESQTVWDFSVGGQF
jgi:outer membrane protein insertion porin family